MGELTGAPILLLPDLHGPCYDEEVDSCVQKLMAALQGGGAVCSSTTLGAFGFATSNATLFVAAGAEMVSKCQAINSSFIY
jgi:hypothetical protein